MNNSENSDDEEKIYKPKALNIVFKETNKKIISRIPKKEEPIKEINIEDFPSLTPTNKTINNNLSPNSWLNIAKKITEGPTDNIFTESPKKQNKLEQIEQSKQEQIENSEQPIQSEQPEKPSGTPKKDKKKIELTDDGWFEVKAKIKVNQKKKKDNKELDNLTNEFIKQCTS